MKERPAKYAKGARKVEEMEFTEDTEGHGKGGIRTAAFLITNEFSPLPCYSVSSVDSSSFSFLFSHHFACFAGTLRTVRWRPPENAR